MRLFRAIVQPAPAMRAAAAVAALMLLLLLFVLGMISAGRGFFPANSDKLVHFLYFGGIAGLVWIALGGGRRAVWIAVVVAAGIGVLDETVQAFTPGRHPSAFDWLADVAGAASVTLTLQAIRTRLVA